MNREISFLSVFNPGRTGSFGPLHAAGTMSKEPGGPPAWGQLRGADFLCGRAGWRFPSCRKRGERLPYSALKKGESCILSAACVLQSLEFESHITAEVNSEIAILPAPTLSQLMNSNPDVERLVYKQAVIQYSGVLRTMQQIIFLSLEKRLATFFCWRRASGDSLPPVPLPMSRSPCISVPPGRW